MLSSGFNFIFRPWAKPKAGACFRLVGRAHSIHLLVYSNPSISPFPPIAGSGLFGVKI